MIRIETDLTIPNTKVFLNDKDISKDIARIVLDARSGEAHILTYLRNEEGKHFVNETGDGVAQTLLTAERLKGLESAR